MKSTLRKLLGRLPKHWQGWVAYQSPCHQSAFGQFGEDLLISRYLPEPRGFYVDIGAFHPKYRSNTFKLWQSGWRGINVDIDDYKIAQFRRFRPHDVNIVKGLSSEQGSREFYFQEQESYGSMSSLDESFALDRGAKMNRSVASRSVEVTTLNRLLDQHLPCDEVGNFMQVDLINIDVEGHEYEILCKFDFDRFRPRSICVEIHAEGLASLSSDRTFQLLTANGYELVAWPAPSCLFLRSDVAEETKTNAA